MHIGARVVLTDTSISIVSSRNLLMTSIPLRTWVKSDGNHWISRLRRNHEVKYLVKRLNAVLNANDHRSLMECISEVVKEPIPAAPQKKEEKPERTQKTIIKKVGKSSSSQLMVGARSPRRPKGANPVPLNHRANPMLWAARAMTIHVR